MSSILGGRVSSTLAARNRHTTAVPSSLAVLFPLNSFLEELLCHCNSMDLSKKQVARAKVALDKLNCAQNFAYQSITEDLSSTVTKLANGLFLTLIKVSLLIKGWILSDPPTLFLSKSWRYSLS